MARCEQMQSAQSRQGNRAKPTRCNLLSTTSSTIYKVDLPKIHAKMSIEPARTAE